ncbi:MAG: NAD(P)H-binding protein [Gallionella sp.]|nr:NAD(P)H-binding protein [Gallionella sp.]
MIAIMGATGKTGGRVAEVLLARGEKVRVIGRDLAKLRVLTDLGAEAAVGDVTDSAFLTQAFAGVESAYTLLPPDMHSPDLRAFQDRVGEATAQALAANKVGRAVFLSTVGAGVPSDAGGIGVAAGLQAQEQRLCALGIDVLMLRPGYFFENFFGSLPLIKYQGINGGPFQGDIPAPMIASQDIGDAAAEALIARDWKGVVVRELLGPRFYTLAEATSIIGRAIGKPDLAYAQFPSSAIMAALVPTVMSADVARLSIELAEAYNNGVIRPGERTAINTTPTTLEAFADVLAGAYAQM